MFFNKASQDFIKMKIYSFIHLDIWHPLNFWLHSDKKKNALFFQRRRPLIITISLHRRTAPKSVRFLLAPPQPLPHLFPVRSCNLPIALPHLHRLSHSRRHTISCGSTRSSALRFCEETTVCFLSCRFRASLLPLHSFRFALLVQDLLLRAVSFH